MSDSKSSDISGSGSSKPKAAPSTSISTPESSFPAQPIFIIDPPKPGPAGFAAEVSLEVRRGPIPPPSDMAEYAKIDPALPRDIFKMAKAQQAHIQRMQRDDLRRQTALEHGERVGAARGQLCGFGVVLLFVGLAAYLAYLGHPKTAATIVCGVVVALVTVFIRGRREPTKSDEASPESN
ncbi:MAG TPA: DUF2335 domain-containing protein [Phycisphaerales bacterium]|nr:DUF2335 domain-containing protein [Phycisphaerales bacterium]